MPFKDPDIRRAKHREYCKAWMAKNRLARIAAGVCHRCRTPVTKFKQCLECRTARQAYYFDVQRPKIQQKARLCKDCGKRCVRRGARRCGSCSALYANAMRWARNRTGRVSASPEGAAA